MGGVATKTSRRNNNNRDESTPTSLSSICHQQQQHQYIISALSPPSSPSAMSRDPRSPTYKRTPVHTPQGTPVMSRPSTTYKERVLSRLAQSPLLDPRSPSMRTPLSKFGEVPVTRTPPPFRLSVGAGADPRSPGMQTRTPLFHTQEIIHVDDDVVVVCDGAVEELMVNGVQQSCDADMNANANLSVADLATPIKSSTELTPSPSMLALSSSNLLYSPMAGARKKRGPGRLDHTLSPLKKSYSAPPTSDENTDPYNLTPKSSTSNPSTSSPLAYASSVSTNNTSSSTTRVRAPLSPLTSQRSAANAYCAPVHPIKFRMDPGILG